MSEVCVQEGGSHQNPITKFLRFSQYVSQLILFLSRDDFFHIKQLFLGLTLFYLFFCNFQVIRSNYSWYVQHEAPDS